MASSSQSSSNGAINLEDTSSADIMGCTRPATATQGDGDQMFRERLSSRQTAVKAMHDDVSDPAEYFILTLVDDLREWRQRSPTVDFRSTGASFDTLRVVGSANKIATRLANLGFFFTLRPDGKGDTKLDIWKPASDRIDPASELGRLFALPAPESQTDKVADKVADKVDYVNREFTRWLLANDGAPVSQFLSTAVYFGGLSDADGTLLRRALLAHGWHADPAAIGVSSAFTFFRRTPPLQQQQ